jgi:glycerol-3-phosphate acyltransferase PlsY
MLPALLAIAVGYAIGSLPIGWIAGRLSGVELRERGSGNTGASNVIESISPALGIVVGIAQIVQGLAAVLIARALGVDDGAQAAAGVAALTANNWNPWLRFKGGRGMGVLLGVLLGLSWAALAAFVVLALAGLVLRAVPQGMAAGLLAMPMAAWVAGAPASVVAGCVALALLAFAKRLLSNEAPATDAPRPDVWINRLVYDRDIRDRDAWVQRQARTGADHAGARRSG